MLEFIIIAIIACFILNSLSPREKIESNVKKIDAKTKERLDDMDDDLDKY